MRVEAAPLPVPPIVYQGPGIDPAGLFATVALMLNIILVMALLSILGATLTLPGIAGIVLTIGMAVDANVLVFERIKEEINKNSSIYNSIRIGYEKALSSIVDANVTTCLL